MKNLPDNAWDRGSVPGLGRSHTPQDNEAQAPHLLRPASPEPVLHDKRNTTMRSPRYAAKRSPYSSQTEKACNSNKNSAQQKINKPLKKFITNLQYSG